MSWVLDWEPGAEAGDRVDFVGSTILGVRGQETSEGKERKTRH